jgi:hypothetical protein
VESFGGLSTLVNNVGWGEVKAQRASSSHGRTTSRNSARS